MTPEKKVKNKVVKILKELGAYYFYPVQTGYGRAGIPDIVGCYRSHFFGIECKAGKNKATSLQLVELEKIRDAEGIAIIINEENVNETARLIKGE